MFRYLAILPVLMLSFSSNAQTFCNYFVPDISYSGDNAPDIRIEMLEHSGDFELVVFPTEKDNPFSLDGVLHLDFYLSNRSKVRIKVTELKKDSFIGLNSKEYPVYLYSPSQVELIQFRSGIIGITYVEVFPGDVIGYNYISDC